MRPYLLSCTFLWGLLLAAPALAAEPAAATLKVDRHGSLVIPSALIRKLGVPAASNGMMCVQFPALPPVKLPRSHGDGHGRGPGGGGELTHVGDSPPRLWLPPRADGSILIRRQRLIPAPEYVPGRAGTVYQVRREKGRLVLAEVRPPKRRR